MESVQEILDQLYKKVLLGAILEDDVYGYIHYLNPDPSGQAGYTAPSLAQSDVNGTLDGVPGQHGLSSNEPTTLPEARECAKRHFQMSTAREVKLLQLTVIDVILSRVLSAETETHAKEKYRELIKALLQSAEIDSKLIWTLQNSDKLLSHMAAKCLSSLLYFQLREKMTLSNPWITFCQKHLSESSGSGEAAHCLWILTAVIKEIFRDSHSRQAEILKQLLAPFDITFEVFYNSLFSQHFGNFQNPSNIVNSLVCFLELLELLIASRIHLKLHFRSQRMLFLKPHALDSLAWPVPAFVKRKLVIVIKKCLLGKMGEDLCRGSVPALMSPDHLLDSDVLALADALLHAVHLGLWKELSVPGKPSCFGGDEVQPGCRPRSGPDHVTLRAASLITVKSLEIKFQNCTSATEMKVDLQKFMTELLTFLKPHLQPSLQLHNPCEWLSRVFIEQDDDMLEAAKASLSIYLQLTRGGDDASGSLTQESEAWIHYTHRNGCNPHCIFLFLLKNIVFDSTVLLDFLISSETCFLEYFVKYLKLLQKDWGHFLYICKFFDAAESQRGVNTRGPVSSLVQDRSTSHIVPDALASPVGRRNACPWVPWASDASSESHSQVVMPKETHTVPAHGPPSQTPLRLVDYGSSEDSDEEATNQHLANSKQTPLCQEMSREIQRLPRTCKDQNKLSREPQLGPLLPQESGPPFSAAGAIAPSGTVWEVGVLFRTVKCLKELQGAIYRLQEKSLFPYNPAALLKLLKGVEAKCDEV
ncbi:protein Lines homolog 1 [Peromyscus eremicus]|uniref:protein Lines homolog 1 n=1 Tax=Peromyscus eremicus TaxID=42410 RepID=UPI0027DBE254|nr:protein Lines homolog 1 [Peromyscus eremicus]XP_059129145.1 protein Lines homolog 1 [Peromyscus eremicus]XP_059129153.1 protein Lines homolog 1 [Peromyscus eremicus]XP_059129161.1 protein Lines homolog 1 [Peromyscus eremicus]